MEAYQEKVRPLTRGEIKQLRADGLYVTQIAGSDDADRAEDAIDATLALVFGAAAVETMPNPVANKLYLDIITETSGRPDDEKNSSGSGSGTATRSESNIAAHAAT
jgi:hypothetical protein